MKKFIPVLLCLVFILSALTTLTVSAATKSDASLEATLVSAKSEYKSSENISLTLTVKNIGSETVKNIQTEIVLPNGFSIASGALKQGTFDLSASESKNITLSVKKGTGSNNGSNANSNANSNNNSSTTAPQTADYSVVVPAIVMFVSGVAIAFIALKDKRSAKGMMSLFLCVAMLGALVLPTAINADSARKELTVEESVKIDGKTETVKAVISYGDAVADNSSDNGSSDSSNVQNGENGQENSNNGSNGADDSQNGGNNSNNGSSGNDNSQGNNENSGNEATDTDNSQNNENGGDASDDQGSGDTTLPEQKPVDTNPAGEEILGEGSAETPYMEIPDSENMTVTTVPIPAGGVLYYDIYRVGGMILVINDPNVYVEYNGDRYDAVNGVVEIWLEQALASDAISFGIGNNGSSDTSFLIEFHNPTGTYMNPTIIDTMGEELQVSLEEGNDTGHYYKYYAEQTGTIRFYINGTVDSLIVITNNRNSAQRSNDGEDVLTDENGEEYVEIEVEEGDELVITVGAKPNKRGKFPATDIVWKGYYI